MSKIKIKESIYGEDKNIGDIVTNGNHLFIVVYVTNKTFNGVVLNSDRLKVGAIRFELNKADYRQFKGTLIIE